MTSWSSKVQDIDNWMTGYSTIRWWHGRHILNYPSYIVICRSRFHSRSPPARVKDEAHFSTGIEGYEAQFFMGWIRYIQKLCMCSCMITCKVEMSITSAMWGLTTTSSFGRCTRCKIKLFCTGHATPPLPCFIGWFRGLHRIASPRTWSTRF